MTKPLELTVYPMWDNGFGDTYADKDDPMRPTRVDFEVFRKMFTDTELAAEYWLLSSRRQRMLGYHVSDNSPTKLQANVDASRMATVERFATLPHASENGYE